MKQDILTSNGTLVGSDFTVNGIPRRWDKIFAFTASTLQVVPAPGFATLNDGETALTSALTINLAAGESWCGLFEEVTHVSGTFTCFRHNQI